MNIEKTKIKKYLIDLSVMLLFIIIAGILSVCLGVERSADTLNYHIYNPWAFLNDRVGFDLLPADIQSYFNPLPDVPYYLMIKYFNNHPAIVTFLWGFSYALFLFMIYKISKFIFKDYYNLGATVVSVFAASCTLMVVRCIGGLSHDIFVADLALISLYILSKSFGKDYHPKLLFCAGLIAGAAVGLKYTAAIFAIPLILAFLMFYRQFTKPIKSFLLLFAGMTAGFLITDGFWMYKLYKEFHNPLFPYFNWIFHSDYISMSNVFTADFSQGIEHITKKNILFFPFYYKLDRHFQVFYSLFFVNLITIPFVNKEKFKEIFKINLIYTDFILTYAFLAYIVVAKSFAVVRYYAPIYGMVGIIAIIILLKLFYILNSSLKFIKNKYKLQIKYDILAFKNTYIIIALICLCIVFILNYVSVEFKPLKRIPVKEKLLGIRDVSIPDNSIVFVERGTGITVPFQNPYAKYIGLNSYRFTSINQVLLSDKYIKQIINLTRKPPRRLYIITREKSPEENECIKTELDRLGLKTNKTYIKRITTNFNSAYYLKKLEIK